MNLEITKPLIYNDGYLLIRRNHKWGLVDNNNNILLDCVYDLIRQIDNDTLGLIFEGHWCVVAISVLPLSFSLVRTCKDCELMFALKDLKYGIVDRYGNVIIPFNYDRIVEYNGYLWACEEYKENKATRYEVFNYDGERISITPLGVIPSYGYSCQKSIRNGLHFVDVEEINGTKGYYVDYDAVKYFSALGVNNLKMKTKQITVKDTGEIIPLIHISGVQDCSSILLNYDLWPINHATKDDLKHLPETVNNLYFRIYYTMDDVIRAEPVWLVLNPGDTYECRLNGKKRETNDQNNNPISLSGKHMDGVQKRRKHNILDKSFHEHYYERGRMLSHQWDDVINEVHNNEDGEWDNYWIDRC